MPAKLNVSERRCSGPRSEGRGQRGPDRSIGHAHQRQAERHGEHVDAERPPANIGAMTRPNKPIPIVVTP